MTKVLPKAIVLMGQFMIEANVDLALTAWERTTGLKREDHKVLYANKANDLENILRGDHGSLYEIVYVIIITKDILPEKKTYLVRRSYRAIGLSWVLKPTPQLYIT